MCNKSIKQILTENGFIVTNKRFGGWDNTNRMITDLKGNEIGYYHFSTVLNKLCNK
jgi:hypothetical protein